MRSYIIAVMALFVLAAIAVTSVNATSAPDTSLTPAQMNQPVLKTMQAETQVNDTQEGQAEKRIWNTFIENFDYQGEIFNSTLHSNASYGDAMIATTALFVLNSQGLADAESITPGEKYEDFHNYTINAMKYFNVYLYNMAKLFETRNARYSVVGREAFNRSVDYYTMGKNEAEFLF